ncbi:helix-turn-helix transcriptional regulator [Miltoncostaea marina]|uniref:helix-turn-helix transcriptional regulator n=1 Tax=Miltoncostaea marina TaxID=2843215 RepID=UPI001C3E521E|nr:helix-turn-helix transcriptional regulator [Miltoncostaea marina]
MHAALRRSDIAAALAFVGEAAGAADSAQFRRHVLEGLPRLVPASMVSYNDISPGGEPVLLLDPPDAMTPERVRDFLRLAGENPLIRHYARTGDPRPMKISDLMDRRTFRRTELYATVYRPMGVEYQMAVSLPAAPGAVVGIALNRDRPDFGERDRAMLELLRPHLDRLRRDAATREAERLVTAVVERVLGDGGRAALAVGRDGVIDFASGRALALLAEYLPPGAGPGSRAGRGAGGLPAPLAAWLRRERARGGLDPARGLAVAGPGGTLAARLLAAAEPGGHDVVLLEERRAGDAVAGLVALGLSPRQAQVLALVADGRTNAAVAAALHLSPRTVQKHLEHVYERLGVRSRAAATAVAVPTLAGARPS